MTERRQFYRIEHPVVIDSQCVSDEQVQHSARPDQFKVSPFFLLQAQLRDLETEAAHCLHRLGEQSPATEACYRTLNRKIDLIARTLAADSLKLDQGETQFVSLSEGGLNFTSNQAIDVGQALALKLVFPDSLLGLLLYARVTRCQSRVDASGHEIGVEFLRMPESCRTQLARLILEAQAKQRQYTLESNT
ncbi:MAG: PilZ domain-containing protein [Marinobacterium sp.]